MKVVVAIDSLKGSLTSIEAGNAAKEGIHRAHPAAEVLVKPLADGGEGTTDALLEGFGGEKVTLLVTGPMKKPVEAYYGILPKTGTAVLEMASAAGITLVTDEEKNPLAATTFGVGEMIVDAVNRGCREFIIGIGGSATNDGGVGMLQAMGYRFYDANGMELGQGADILSKMVSVSCKKAHPGLAGCRFRIACDVTSPLCGRQGATYVFGPQKGVTEDMKKPLDAAMQNYADVTKKLLLKDVSQYPGTGAAGGMGFAFLAYLNAELTPGIHLILNAISLEQDIIDADYVVTGEGMLDRQTAMGKVPVGVAALAKQYGRKVIAFAGGVSADAAACNAAGIDAFFPIVRGVTTLAQAMDKTTARENMAASVEQVFRLLT